MNNSFCTFTKEALLEEFQKKKNTLLLFHRNPDADALGSSLALYEMLSQTGSAVVGACISPLPDRLRFLMGDEMIAFGKENIPKDFSPERIIALDTASPSQLGDLFPIYEGKIDLMIDHHAVGTPFADHYIDPKAAATGEILFDLAKELQKAGKIQLNSKICNRLYAAISADTGCFRFSNTTPSTHMRAAELLKEGVPASDINHDLFDCKSREQLLAESYAAANLALYFDGRVAVVRFPYSKKVTLGLADEHLETLVDVARSLIGVEVAIAIRQPSEAGIFRVSTRSATGYDVSALCGAFGGGGHKKAAGCTIEADSIDAAAEKLLAVLKETL
ncbi:MAG: DHH family phosphoesterase [Clostridia bacterium]|nr:DHH family phosphoesterase [Clostridia bacterium]